MDYHSIFNEKILGERQIAYFFVSIKAYFKPSKTLLTVAERDFEKAEWYASHGYIHYREFDSVEDGFSHPTKIGLVVFSLRAFRKG